MTPLSMTLNDPNPNFKVKPLFNVEYLKNDARYRHGYNELVIETYALLKPVIWGNFE